MIVIAESPRCENQNQDEHPTRNFEDLLPAIRKHAHRAFRSLPANDREELIADTLANAFCAYQRLVEQGKADLTRQNLFGAEI